MALQHRTLGDWHAALAAVEARNAAHDQDHDDAAHDAALARAAGKLTEHAEHARHQPGDDTRGATP